MGTLIDRLRTKPVNIIITNVCNLKCGGCSQQCGLIPKDKLYFIDSDQFDTSVRVATSMHHDVHLFGGEASLHPQVETFLARTERYPGNQFYIWTNGRYGRRGRAIRTYYTGTSFLHDRYPNVVVQVDHEKAGRRFLPTLVAPADAAPLPARSDYFTVYARQHCPMWKSCSMLFYGDRAYACECAGSFDRLKEFAHGWPVTDGFLDGLTDADVVAQLSHFCYRCGFCLPPELKARYVQFADAPPVTSLTNRDLVPITLAAPKRPSARLL